MTVYGWDISNHDWNRRAVSLANAKAAGISLVTHKATEGDWYRDPYLGKYAAQLAGARVPVAGTYHVLNHGIDVARQTDYWINYVNAEWPLWRRHPCPIWQIDAEPLDGYAAPTKAEILACGQHLVSKLGIKPTQVVVYGPAWVYGNKLLGIPYHLWASHYVSGGGPFKGLYPGDGDSRWGQYSGQTPLILQYSSTSTIGSQPECDANATRVASAAELQAKFAPTPTDPDLGEEMALSAAAKTEIAQIVHAELGKYTRLYDPKTKKWDNGGHEIRSVVDQMLQAYGLDAIAAEIAAIAARVGA